MSSSVLRDVHDAKNLLSNCPVHWDGKASILEMKEAKFQWRQMEWWAFYFELLCQRFLQPRFTFPGTKYGRITFDMAGAINWDLKAKAIKSDDHRAILNDQIAVHSSIKEFGSHGTIIALCDVEYNDVDRTFQQWHSTIKEAKSKYETEREKRTNTSRYRKTKVDLVEILFLEFTETNVSHLDEFKQGRNSNGNPRAPKYMVNLEQIEPFLIDRLVFKPVDES